MGIRTTASKIAAYALTASLLAGCYLRSNPEPVEPMDPPVTPAAERDCFDGSPQVIRDYMDGNGDPQKITALCDCASKAVTQFAEKTKGAQAGEYSPDELKGFLERYFLAGTSISPVLLREAMYAKQALFGGSTQKLTYEELRRARKLIDLIKGELLRLREHLPFSPDVLAARGEGAGEWAAIAFARAGGSLGQFLADRGGEYSFERFSNLLREMENASTQEGSRASLAALRAKIPVFQSLKQILIGPPVSLISGADWATLFSDGTRWFGLWVRLATLAKRYPEWIEGKVNPRLFPILRDARALMEAAVARHPGGAIPLVEFDQLTDAIPDDSLFASRDVTRALFRLLVTWMHNGSPEAGNGGINPLAVQRLFAVIESYFEGKIGQVDGLLSHLMQIKRSVLGGDAQFLRPADLERIQEISETVRAQADKISKYGPITREHLLSLSPAQFDEVIAALSASGDALSAVLAKIPSAPGDPDHLPSYSLEEVDRIVGELERYFGKAEWLAALGLSKDVTDFLRRRLPLIKALKSVLVAPPAEGIARRDWSRIVSETPRWYALWLRYDYLSTHHRETWLTGPARERMAALVDASVGLLGRAVEAHPARNITFGELDRVVDALPSEMLFTQNREVLKEALRPVFCHLAQGAPDFIAPECETQGVAIATVQAAQFKSRRWLEGLRIWDELFQALVDEHGESAPLPGHFATATILEKLFDQKFVQKLKLDSTGEVAFESVRRVLAKSVRSYFSDDLGMSFPIMGVADYYRREYRGLSELVRWFSVRSAAEVIVEGYGHGYRPLDPRLEMSLNYLEFQRLMTELAPLAAELKILDTPRPPVAIMRQRFADANLFTWTADADSIHMGVDEAGDYLAMGISSSVLGLRMHRRIAQECPTYGEDAFGEARIGASCFRAVFFKGLRQWQSPEILQGVVDRLPGMGKAYTVLAKDKARTEFEQNLDRVARGKQVPVGAHYQSGESQSLVMLIQYIESVYRRYDLNRSGSLEMNDETDEVSVLYRTFKGALVDATLKQGIKLNSKGLRALFTFILAKGYPPDDLGAKLEYFGWGIWGKHKFETDRPKVVGIFRRFADMP